MKPINALRYDSNKNLKLNIKDKDYVIHISSMFLKTEDTENKTVYDVQVIITKYGIGLYTLTSCDDDYNFPYVYKDSPKKDLKKLVNNVTKKAFTYARHNERYIFSRSGMVHSRNDT